MDPTQLSEKLQEKLVADNSYHSNWLPYQLVKGLA